MEQTSVEWLYQEITKKSVNDPSHDVFSILQQANKMFEKQIIDAYCHNNIDDVIMREFAEQYYNKTFKQD